MQIPPEIVPFSRSDTNSTSTGDDKKTEPVGKSAELGSALSESAGERDALRYQKHSRLATGKRESWTKPGNRRLGEERRKEERRKESLSVLIDTRSSKSRRESSRNGGINVTA